MIDFEFEYIKSLRIIKIGSYWILFLCGLSLMMSGMMLLNEIAGSIFIFIVNFIAIVIALILMFKSEKRERQLEQEELLFSKTNYIK